MNGIGQDLRFGWWAEVVEGLQASFLDGRVGLASGSHLVREAQLPSLCAQEVIQPALNRAPGRGLIANRPIF